MFRRFRALFTPFYTPNVVHVYFSVEKIPANSKTRSFKFRRKLCHFVPDRDTAAFKRSFHTIRHAVCSACRFQCRNNPCNSQNAIFQISLKTLLFRSGLSITALKRSFHHHCTRRTYCMSISMSKQSLQIAKRDLPNFVENSVISLRIVILRHLNALSTPLDTPNVVHVYFSIESIPANRKTRSFKFRRKLCHFVPD
jgi:hypothetical protein